MNEATFNSQPATITDNLAAPANDLLAAIHRAAHLLPSQGPIDVFIHHNTLHAFEHHKFDEAVRVGSTVFGCEPYLTLDRYREELMRGRILFSELSTVLHRDLGDRANQVVQGLSSRLELRLAMLQHPLQSGQGEELDWFMAETEALRRARKDVSEVQRRRMVTEMRYWVMRHLRGSVGNGGRPPWTDGLFAQFNEARIESWSDAHWESFTLTALWETCLEGVRQSAVSGPRTDSDTLASSGNNDSQESPSYDSKSLVRHRDFGIALGGMDSDLLVNDVLIRLCAAFLDQGISHCSLPGREQGLFHVFCELYGRSEAGIAWWLKGIQEEVVRLRLQKIGPLASIQQSMDELGVTSNETDAFLSATMLALRGWGGMFWHVEQRPDRVHQSVPQGSFVEFLAVRLILDRWAIRAAVEHSLGYQGKLSTMRAELARQIPSCKPNRDKQRAFSIFQLAQILGWTPERLFRLDAAGWSDLLNEVESFGDLDRRRLFHLAYEHRFRVQTLDALEAPTKINDGPSSRPTFQAVFCIDEREESIRRHVEELMPTAETFGVAGFFGVVMYYRGAAAVDFVPLCPVVVRPQNWVSEIVDESLRVEDDNRRRVRRHVGMALQAFHGGSRRIVSGALLAATVGLLATIPLVAQVVFPRLTARFQGFFRRFIATPPKTKLVLERGSSANASPIEGEHGFTLAEMANIAERLLRDMGMTSRFARLVFLMGHGSTSMNNPHESAHDCGACGGGVGGPNARAAAQILNDPRIRVSLNERGINVPSDTVFIGGLHNTSKDDLTFYDADQVPATHQHEFDAACSTLHAASVRNAHERARRFGSAPLALTLQAAKRHMEGRAEDLSQVRPEWGHATNAICVVGRRKKTRGLFLDRRAFLVSYDPEQDDQECSILARILGAVVPVCSGINLEYYFSYVDSPGWGSGSKLPHNITGLLGVMDGAMSDLRTGLPWQMVEIHEPVRLLFVIEATPATLFAIMERNSTVKMMIANEWVQLAAIDPSSGGISIYHEGVFEPYCSQGVPLPIAPSSLSWYAGWREPLEFAEILASKSFDEGHGNVV